MAKKTKKATGSNANGFVRGCAYFALIIAATIFLVDGIFHYFEISGFEKLLSVVSLVGKLCLAVGIGFAAYEFTCGKAVVWRVLFWIALVVYVLGCVFGIL